MDDFSRFAAEIGRQIEERQAQLKAACDQEEQQIQKLRELLKSIGGTGDAFDAEDREAVLKEISSRELALQKVSREAKRQEEIRRQKEAILLQLHMVLTTRTRILEQADEDSAVLKENQPLLAFFAQKQLNLMEMLKTRMRELMEAMPSSQ
jgi:hypothetical protein